MTQPDPIRSTESVQAVFDQLFEDDQTFDEWEKQLEKIASHIANQADKLSLALCVLFRSTEMTVLLNTIRDMAEILETIESHNDTAP